MAAADPEQAEIAESVVEWLTAGNEDVVIGLAGVQRFVWYELPVKWLALAGRHREVLEAAADLFDRLGFDRYAAVCRAPVTVEVHDAYAESLQAGIDAYREAFRRSGIDPPDLDDFVWGDLVAREEAVAAGEVERALEEAMTEDKFTVGARGWKLAAAEVTAAVLDAPHSGLPGQTYRTTILTERLDSWIRIVEDRSPRLHALRSRYAKSLLHPIPVPADVAERIKPVAWFLDQIDLGANLTPAGYLPTSMVRDGCERFGWKLMWTDRSPRSESEVSELFELDDLLRGIGAVRPRKGALLLTAKGRRLREDPATAWRAIAADLSRDGWIKAVAEVFTLLLLDGERLDHELKEEATAALVEYGWRNEFGSPNAMTVASAWWETKLPLAALGGIVESGDWRSRTTQLTEFGAATLLEQIRAHATGPLRNPW